MCWNTRQVVQSRTVKAESLHGSVKAGNSSAQHRPPGAACSTHSCCQPCDKPCRARDGPRRAAVPILQGENSPGGKASSLPSAGPHQPFITPVQPHLLLELCLQLCFLEGSELSNQSLLPCQIKKSSMKPKHLCPGAA